MKIVSLNTKIIYDIDFTSKGYIKCPECLDQRKKKNTKPFRVNATKTGGYCYHCNTSFVEYKPFKTEKKYIIPEWKNKTELTEKALRYFNSRMIGQETLIKMKVYSDVHYIGEYGNVEVMCFPYYFNDKLVNIKYRGPGKSFGVVQDAELILYNFSFVSCE